MKRLLAYLVFIAMLIALITPMASATVNAEEELVRLSSLSEEECIEFLMEHGVVIPEGIEGSDMRPQKILCNRQSMTV